MTTIHIRIPEWLDRICAWPVMLYRKWKYGYSFRRIYLGEGKFTKVDPEDYYRFNIYNWCAKENGKCISVVRIIGTPDKKTRIVSLHREILNPPKNKLVDHRNCDASDNRRENLRLATYSQNGCNRGKTPAKCTSKYKGVRLRKETNRRRRWEAKIFLNRKRKLLGYYLTEVEAARAYDEAAKKYHGEFARLNFPEDT